jgi:hypothetical protein
MTRHSSVLFTAAGSLALALGIGSRLWAYGNFAHFASGFFVGVSIALLMLGMPRQSTVLPGARRLGEGMKRRSDRAESC